MKPDDLMRKVFRLTYLYVKSKVSFQLHSNSLGNLNLIRFVAMPAIRGGEVQS